MAITHKITSLIIAEMKRESNENILYYGY
jgi:hypothetical protein